MSGPKPYEKPTMYGDRERDQDREKRQKEVKENLLNIFSYPSIKKRFLKEHLPTDDFSYHH